MSSAVMGDGLAMAFYGKKAEELEGKERDFISNLATAIGAVAGGSVGGDTFSAASGANAARVEVENNNLAAVVRLGVTACSKIASCRNMVVEKGLGALLGIGVAKTAMDNLSDADCTMLLAAAMTGKADAIERLTPEQQAAYKEMVEGQKGTLLPLPALDRPLVDSTLTNPIPEQSKGTALTTPDQRDRNGSSHTGNTDGKPNTGGSILVNPGADPFTKKDVVYLSENSNNKIDSIINETLSGKKNFTSSTTLTSDEALAAGLKFFGAGYKEIGKSGSGVYHSVTCSPLINTPRC
ncbi:VENN motif pre-toxin domain-containing protein [Cedecea neteri]|uniref:VENN motif pre-toxin domain-containing protein n=1 Tax=Cedecea neteri TaxID=158822 RepID=UPI0009DFFE72|nr:VENN motif pre-toxin domain-containing protein [Cedecea neteri]